MIAITQSVFSALNAFTSLKKPGTISWKNIRKKGIPTSWSSSSTTVVLIHYAEPKTTGKAVRIFHRAFDRNKSRRGRANDI
jgi:hypothetical protein